MVEPKMSEVPEVKGIRGIRYVGEGEDGRRYLSIVYKGTKKEGAVKLVYLLGRSEVQFEKGTVDRNGNFILLFSVRRLNPWEI